MGRLDENTTPSNYPGQSQFQTPTGQQPQEYRFGGVTQAPDTIDDVPPPFEFGNEENQQENYQNEPSERHKTGPSKATNEGLENQENFQQESQPSSPTAQSREPITVAPTSGPQAVHFPPHNAQFPTTRSSASGIPPQVRPQAFPPPQGQPQAFPQHGAQPQAFPPPEAFPPDKPAAFPPPQAFPPPEADQIHAFPPQAEPVNFPPYQPVFKQPNMAQFTPATNYSYPAANMNAAMGSPAINPGSPFGQNAHMINNYPQGIPVVNQTPTEAWKSSLFDCMDDPENALITACFPCVTFGQIAEIIDQGQTSCGTSGCLYGLIAFCIALPCLISCGYRTKLRSRLGLVEAPAPDWIVHCFCEWCALCQEYRELKGRGLDPAIGWQGNLMQQQMATMTPPMHPMMGR